MKIISNIPVTENHQRQTVADTVYDGTTIKFLQYIKKHVFRQEPWWYSVILWFMVNQVLEQFL